jgi:phenylacetate-coenzyme A ligase PaaK-like adenylate-forming protein
MGATQGHFAGVSSACMVRQFPLTLFYELRTYEINRPLREALNDMNVYQPHVVVGYGTALKALAEKVLEGELKIRPRLVTNSGEPILASDREVIERAFGKCIRNLYTCSEHMFMGLKESWHDSMCLFEDDLFFEINPDHTLITNMFNRLLPLIRYKMTDILTPLDLPEHRPYRAIAEVAGRVESQAKFKNRHGSTDGISPHTINEIIIPHVRKFQMRLRGPESFEFAVVLEPGIGDDQRRHALEAGRNVLSGILKEKEMDNVRFDITIVDEIPVDARTGKFRLILYAAAAAQ